MEENERKPMLGDDEMWEVAGLVRGGKGMYHIGFSLRAIADFYENLITSGELIIAKSYYPSFFKCHGCQQPRYRFYKYCPNCGEGGGERVVQ